MQKYRSADNGRGTRVCKYDRVITRDCRAEPSTLSPACNLAPAVPCATRGLYGSHLRNSPRRRCKLAQSRVFISRASGIRLSEIHRAADLHTTSRIRPREIAGFPSRRRRASRGSPYRSSAMRLIRRARSADRSSPEERTDRFQSTLNWIKVTLATVSPASLSKR